MAQTVAQLVPKNAQQGFIDYHKFISTVAERQWNLRQMMKNIDLAYLREQDLTTEHLRAKIMANNGDTDRFQNITVPVIKPQVNSAVAYQAAIFLSDYPMFPVIADPQFIDQAKQLQAVIEENSIRGAWARELMLFFYDGFKYNISALEVTWKKVVTAALDTDPSFKGGLEGKPKEIIWAGNCLKRWDPYNTFMDTRCSPYDIPTHGEFAGHTELMSRVQLKAFVNSLETKLLENIVPAFESPSILNVANAGEYGASYFLPLLNSEALVNPEDLQHSDWSAWMGLTAARTGGKFINYKGLYEVTTEYVRILPSDFQLRVPAPNTPQVWKLIIVNHSILIYAERQTNAHEKIPVFFGCPSEDGLSYQTKSLASDGKPFQQVASALMNSIIAGRRRAVTDRILYDPSRISEQHINNPNPSAKIPVRPAAYGKPIGESVYQFPFRDDQAAISMQQIQMVIGLGNVLNGQNQARQGQFVKGNKTDSQWESTMSNATSKDQLTALLYEAQVFTPLKEVLKINTLQYQTSGTVYSPSAGQEVKIDPLQLRQATLNFKITDGLLPAEKVISSDALKAAMQVVGSSTALAQGYNIAPLFSYIMKTENVNLAPFEKSPQQVAYEQALATWNNLAQLSIQKGVPFNQPQPLPQQYGFDPQVVDPRNAASAQQLPTNVAE
jgi:hypothetical protein